MGRGGWWLMALKYINIYKYISMNPPSVAPQPNLAQNASAVPNWLFGWSKNPTNQTANLSEHRPMGQTMAV